MVQSRQAQKKQKKLSVEERNYFVMTKNFDLQIGIDTGVNTGVAVWSCHKRQYIYLNTLKYVEAQEKVLQYKKEGWRICVRIEDARRRRIGETKKQMYDRHAKGDYRTTEQISAAKAQGVGAVKQHAKLWEQFLEKHEIDFILVAPRQNFTKTSNETFIKFTGIDSVKLLGKVKSEHARDAAMLVLDR